MDVYGTQLSFLNNYFFSMRFLVVLLLVSLLHVKLIHTAPINAKGDQFHGLFNGRVTFFHPATEGGAWGKSTLDHLSMMIHHDIGACGPHENDHSRIVALVRSSSNAQVIA